MAKLPSYRWTIWRKCKPSLRITQNAPKVRVVALNAANVRVVALNAANVRVMTRTQTQKMWTVTLKYTKIAGYDSKIHTDDDLLLKSAPKGRVSIGCLDNCMTEQLCGKYYLYYEWTRKYSVLKWAKNNNNNNTFGTKERKFWTFFFRVKSIELCKIVIDLGVYLQ